jgi:flagellar basal body-associated protein FliL
MGPIGISEIIMIFVVMIVLAIPVVIAIALIWYFSSRSKPPQLPQGPKSVQERLSEIDDLRARNLISEAEHEEKRKQILSGI